MIYENATMTVPQENIDAFKKAVDPALKLFLNSPACTGARILQCLEDPTQFLLVVEWSDIPSHLAFRGTEFGAQWREALAGLRNDGVVANHFELISSAKGQ